MHVCVGNLTIIGTDNGLSPGRRQAIIRTNARILLIGPLGRNFSGILSEIHTFSFKKMHFKTSSAKWRPFCLSFNVLTHSGLVTPFGKNKSGLTLVQIMTCCLMAPSHYLDQCWLIINKVQRHSSEKNSQELPQPSVIKHFVYAPSQ